MTPYNAYMRRALRSLTIAAILIGAGAIASARVPGTSQALTIGSSTDTQTTPAVSGSYVLWTDNASLAGGGTNADIYLLDLSTGAAAINLTNTPDQQEFLEDVDGTHVVYSHSNATMPGDIVLYDASTGIASTIAGSSTKLHYEQPAIRGRYVVYIRATTQFDVDGYDNALGLPFAKPVTNDAAIQARPRVAGDFIVYEDYGAGNADVYGYQISAGGAPFPIATGPSPQSQPDIDGNLVVWVDSTGGIDQIYSYDLNTRITQALTTASSHKLSPRISGTRVVWADDRSGNLDIYSYDVATGTEDVVVDGAGDQMLSDIDGNRVVYTSNASGFEEVYLFTIATPPPPPDDQPEGCDPKKTDAADAPVVVAKPTKKSVLVSHSFNATPGRNYYVCIENGLPDGTQKTSQLLFNVDGTLVFNPSDFKPNANPPHWVASPILDGKGHGGKPVAGTKHLWAAALFGNEPTSTVTVTLRVHK
jgi:beta propeller repeat protein